MTFKNELRSTTTDSMAAQVALATSGRLASDFADRSFLAGFIFGLLAVLAAGAVRVYESEGGRATVQLLTTAGIRLAVHGAVSCVLFALACYRRKKPER